MRNFTSSDRLIIASDNALKTLFGGYHTTSRENPADSFKEDSTLEDKAKKHTAGLMRVNHAGEVCAQALYQGQALTAKLPEVRQKMELAAIEENDHLNWCETRLKELNSHTSLCNKHLITLSVTRTLRLTVKHKTISTKNTRLQ